MSKPKALRSTIEEFFETEYSLFDIYEDFAEHFCFFILKPSLLSYWNYNKINAAFDLSRADNKTIMKAYKDNNLLTTYLKLITETVTF